MRANEYEAIVEDCRASGMTIREYSEKIGVSVQTLHTWIRKTGKRLTAFLDDPNIPLSNNRAENAIRPFVVGRKNWLFSDTVRGAESSAVIYSLIETAKANGQNPEIYIAELLKK